MTTTTPPRTPLDGIITCGACAEPLDIEPGNAGQEPRYTCRPSPGNGWTECGTPKLRAHQADVLIIGEILDSIITDETTEMILAAATGSPKGDQTGEHGLTNREVDRLKNNPAGVHDLLGRSNQGQRLPGRLRRRSAGPPRQGNRLLRPASAQQQPPRGTDQPGREHHARNQSLKRKHGELKPRHPGPGHPAHPGISQTGTLSRVGPDP